MPTCHVCFSYESQSPLRAAFSARPPGCFSRGRKDPTRNPVNWAANGGKSRAKRALSLTQKPPKAHCNSEERKMAGFQNRLKSGQSGGNFAGSKAAVSTSFYKGKTIILHIIQSRALGLPASAPAAPSTPSAGDGNRRFWGSCLKVKLCSSPRGLRLFFFVFFFGLVFFLF